MTKRRIVEILCGMNFKAAPFHRKLHRHITRYEAQALKWYEEKSREIPHPFYSGFDIRDSSHKVVPVDANVFPAGFNNLSEGDQDQTARLMDRYLKRHHPSAKNILLLTEEHTHNRYYWNNVLTLKALIEKGGCQVTLCVARELVSGEKTVTAASGRRASLHLLKNVRGDLMISNNDFSSEYELPPNIPCLPPLEMGWKTRRKHDFFIHYNRLAREFAALIDMDPCHFQVKTDMFTPFDVTSRENLKELKSRVADFFNTLKPPESSREKTLSVLKKQLRNLRPGHYHSQ